MAGNTLPAAAPGGGRDDGASASIALIRLTNDGVEAPGADPGSNAANGRASRARIMLRRNSLGRGSTKARTARSNRSGNGRAYSFSILTRA